MERHNFAKGTIFISIGMFIAYSSNYIIHFVLVRLITPEEYGTYGLILTTLTLIQTFLMRGLPDAISRYIAAGYDTEDVKKKAIYIQYVLLIILVVFIIAGAPSIASFFKDETLQLYIIYLAILIPFVAFSFIYTAVFTGLREFKKTSARLILTYLSKLILVVSIVFFTRTIFGILTGFLIANIIGFVAALVLYNPKHSEKKIQYSQLIHFAIPIVIFSFLFQFFTTVNIYMFKRMAQFIRPEEIGYYSAAQALCIGFLVFSIPFSKTLLPTITVAISSNNSEQAQKNIYISLRYIIHLFLPIAAIVASKAYDILTFLFTARYSSISTVLSILVIAYMFSQIFFILSAIINAMGKTYFPVIVTFISIIFLITLNSLYFIPKYQLIGAACSFTAISMLSVIANLFYIKKLIPINYPYKSFIKAIFAASIIFGLGIFIPVKGFGLLIYSFAMIIVYLLILVLIKEMDQEDRQLFKDLLSSLL